MEALTGLVERRLHGARRDPEDFGDLPDGKVGEVVEDDRTALAFRELEDGALQIHVRGRGGVVVGGTGGPPAQQLVLEPSTPLPATDDVGGCLPHPAGW